MTEELDLIFCTALESFLFQLGSLYLSAWASFFSVKALLNLEHGQTGPNLS